MLEIYKIHFVAHVYCEAEVQNKQEINMSTHNVYVITLMNSSWTFSKLYHLLSILYTNRSQRLCMTPIKLKSILITQ